MLKNLFLSSLVGVTFVVSSSFAAAPKLNAAGVNALGLKVISKVRSQSPKANIFISPLSLHEAMSMVYSGSLGTTRAELAKFLGLGKSDPEEVSEAYATLHHALRSADPKVILNIANSMWANSDQRVKFTKEFVKLNERGHDAQIVERNFQDKGFVGEVNQWCSDHTQKKITDVLKGPIRKEQLFYLINAIYFKGAWQTEFDKKVTRDGQFHAASGLKVKAHMMNQDGKYPYAENTDAQAVKLPYGKDGRVAMAVYLPKAGRESAFLTKLDAQVAALSKAMASKKGSVELPRFKVRYNNEKVVELFQALGLTGVFTDAAELGGIAEGEEAKINKIIHQAVVEVNEEGTEAAAVTVIGGVRATSIHPVEIPFRLVADRPFYYEIVDNELGLTLFSGILNEAKESE